MIRSYKDEDYESIKRLYGHTEWFGGVFDEARDSRKRLAAKITDDEEAILVYEKDNEITGTISIIEDGRVAWLYRFVVTDFDPDITRQLYESATNVLKKHGHSEVLVYTPAAENQLNDRYASLGMTRGGTYSCFYKELS